MVNPSISVIIPNYNGKHLLEKNLPSVVEALSTTGSKFEIIVVDDFSTDDSVKFINTFYAFINLIECAANGGFSKACNKGLSVAKYQLVMFLNNDIQLIPYYFNDLFKYFEEPDTFGVMGRIMGVNGETHDTARLFSRTGLKIKANSLFHVKEPNFLTPTAYLSGANALVDAKKVRELGGFDEIFSPFYYEDFEMGMRAWRIGWKCYYHHFTYCIHDHSSTTKSLKRAEWIKSIFFRNRLIMHAIHLSYPSKILWYLQLILLDSLFSALLGKTHFFKSFFMFLKMRKQVKHSKKRFEELMSKKNSNASFQNIRIQIEALLSNQVLFKGKEK